MKIKRYLAIGSVLLLPFKALAFCPLCVVATGACLWLARWLGIDDSIVGLWIGGFAASTAMFLNNFLIKKGKTIRFQLPLIIIASYVLIILPLYWQVDFLNPLHRILGINKAIFGLILGSLLLFVSPQLDKFLRKLNQGKIFISHQKVLIGIGLLLICSSIFYLTIK